jgi:hypothetical protein
MSAETAKAFAQAVLVTSLCVLCGHGMAQTATTIATAQASGENPMMQGLSRIPGERATSANSSDHWLRDTRTGETRRLFVVKSEVAAVADFGALSLGGVGVFAQGTKPPEVQYLGWPYEWNSGAHVTSYTTGAWTDWWTVRTPSGLETNDVQVRVSGVLHFTNFGVNWNSEYQNAGQLFAVSLNGGTGVAFSLEDKGNYGNQYIEWEAILSLPLNHPVEIKGSAILRAETRDQSWWNGSVLKRELLGSLSFYTSSISVLGVGGIQTGDRLASFESSAPLTSYTLFASSGALELGDAGYNYKAANAVISSIPEPQSVWMLMAGLAALGAYSAKRRVTKLGCLK